MSNGKTILVTGPRGFIAGHLVRRLSAEKDLRILTCSRADFHNPFALASLALDCDTIIHLAGVNRGDEREIYETNTTLVDRLIESLTKCDKPPHIVFASSTQRERSNSYGRSKKYGEEQLRKWTARTGGRATILVIPNVYGAGCRPYHNSVVATFCHQLTHNQQPIVIDDQPLELLWVNDLVEAILEAVRRPPAGVEVARIAGSARIIASQLLSKLQAFRQSYFDDQIVPSLTEPFDASLYTTFLSHVELKDHCHRPRLHSDANGQLFEILRLAGGGQIFFSTTKPGVIRGNHFHSRKIEWFCVVRGEAVIRLRRVGDGSVREFRVSGDSPQFISIPPLYTHQIENVGGEDLLTMFWCNEIFQASDPDTYFEQVA
ncbi:MAG: NAD-dependent epimerase/dehydratase family protein [Planctomycetes bacterium]|nr:NAD-dependent epimerase/dehydratase family protein [Planctomycetota bacterium]